MGRFRNWGRTASCSPVEVARPATEEELRAVLASARARGLRVKVVGGGHSWSDAACTDGVQVSLDDLCRVLRLGPGEVQVEAGIRLEALNVALEEFGLALPILGSIAKQSVAGAMATGTHGSGPRHGSLSSLCTGLRLMLADGTVQDLTEGPLFDAARVGLGALGIVTRVTLRCEPAFRLEEEAAPMPFEEAVASIPRLLAEEHYVKLWWLPHTDSVQVFRYRRTIAPSTFNPLLRLFDEHVVNRVIFAAALALSRLIPAIIPALNRVIRRAYFRPVRRVARSDLALTIAMPPVHQEVEYAVPVERAQEALRGLRALIDREALRVNFVAELRFVAQDSAWLSPAYGRATAFLGAYMAESRGRARYFEAFERAMLALGGRPHWGKQFGAGPDDLAAAYPRYADFAALRLSVDPDGLFENAYLGRLFPRRAALPSGTG